MLGGGGLSAWECYRRSESARTRNLDPSEKLDPYPDPYFKDKALKTQNEAMKGRDTHTGGMEAKMQTSGCRLLSL
jgi:hypothetical protein